MTIPEFDDQFDLLYGNITNNQAPGLSTYEKSVFLTKAEKEIVKDYFTANSKGNNIGQGFDDSAKRQADFSVLMKTAKCTQLTVSSDLATLYSYKFTPTGSSAVYPEPGTIYFMKVTPNGEVPYQLAVSGTAYTVNAQGAITISSDTINVYINGVKPGAGTLLVSGVSVGVTSRIDDRSFVYSFPSDVFIPINETVKVNTVTKQVIPLRFDEYIRLMSKPYKRPLKNQVWRLMNTGTVDTEGNATKIVELICGPEVSNLTDTVPYSIRYIRVPKPIVVGDLDGLTIDGVSAVSTKCEIDPILHDDILQRAVELAKIAWTANGQDNVQLVMQAGQRSE